ncbi:hypothetical protein N7461_004432 [Penicillium sp. DV-2018c]|nr:hypothetical protein N7461_004432 [Penicillium sp. DV-2018c]
MSGPEKSELVRFTRTRLPRTEGVRILGPRRGPGYPSPVESARFLGAWHDRKLSFKEHAKRVRVKLDTQSLALTRLYGETWGVRVSKAREIYTEVIRSVVAYGASAWRTPTPKNGNPRGPAKPCSRHRLSVCWGLPGYTSPQCRV